MAEEDKPKIQVAAMTQMKGNTDEGNLNDPQHRIQQQIQTINTLLRSGQPAEVKFNKKLLDFDYSDDEGADGDDKGGDKGEAVQPNQATLEALQALISNEAELEQLIKYGGVTHYQIQQLKTLLPPAVPPLDPTPTVIDVPDTNDDIIEIVEETTKRKSSRWRSRSRSRSRSPRRRISGRPGRARRSRSRSRERKEEREKRREREKKGLPAIKKDHLSVCSTTLWVGHLSKLVAEEDLSDVFGEFGAIEVINLIPPRGCAFVCMNRRMDASKALRSLNKTKIHGKPITLAWAPGKGMKDKQWKDYWDVEVGCSYIPISKLDPQIDMASLEDGGTFDEDTMPEWMKNMRGVVASAPLAALPPTAIQPTAVLAVPPTFIAMPPQEPPAAAAAAPFVGPPLIHPPPPTPPVQLPNLAAPPPNIMATLPPPPLAFNQPPPIFNQPPPGVPPGIPPPMEVPEVEMEICDNTEDNNGLANRLRNLAESPARPRSLLTMPDLPRPEWGRGGGGPRMFRPRGPGWGEPPRPPRPRGRGGWVHMNPDGQWGGRGGGGGPHPSPRHGGHPPPRQGGPHPSPRPGGPHPSPRLGGPHPSPRPEGFGWRGGRGGGRGERRERKSRWGNSSDAPPGPMGAAGPSGPEDPSGPSGQSGTAGPASTTGSAANTGTEGSTGPSGPLDTTGPAGPAGNPEPLKESREKAEPEGNPLEGGEVAKPMDKNVEMS